MKDLFRRLASRISNWTGSAQAFLLAFGVVIVWAISGPAFNFSSTWQLFINTGTTIVTFLMVFLIQNTQNRDGKAMQLKLDELIRASKAASDNFLDLEDMTDEELDVLDEQFKQMHEKFKQQAPKAVHTIHKRIAEARELRHTRS